MKNKEELSDAVNARRAAAAMIAAVKFRIEPYVSNDEAERIAHLVSEELRHQICGEHALRADCDTDKVDAGPAPDTSSVASNEASNSSGPYSHVSLQINMHPSAKIFGADYHHTGGTININTDGRPESIAQAALAVAKILGLWPEEG